MNHLDHTLERPFHFGIVLWGERFRNYFLEYCLPSLLSPNNIPALSTHQQSKFLIATRPEDWEAMRRTPIFAKLALHVAPVYMEIPACPSHRSGCDHMGIGHKLICEYAFQEKAYIVHVTPDSMFSEGAIARLQSLAAEGKELVLCAALRFGEEPFFSNLQARHAIPSAGRRNSGLPLSISARDLVWAALNGLHSETLGYEWEAPYFILTRAAAWWRVPDQDGIVLHCLSWAPLLLDFAAVSKLDVSMLENWTIDGDFLHRNTDSATNIYVIEDSDEIFFCSWTPMSERLETNRRFFLFRINALRDIFHAAELRRTYFGPTLDPLKQQLFLRTIRWHSQPLTDAWQVVEGSANKMIRAYVDRNSPEENLQSVPRLSLVKCAGVLLSVIEPLFVAMLYRKNVSRRIGQLFRGDKLAMRRIAWHVERNIYQIAGRPFAKPAPRSPD